MNLPNKISLFRIVLVPIIVIVYLFVDLGDLYVAWVNNSSIIITVKDLLLLILFIIASISDYMDGKIAREFNMITSFGKFIDPIADKLLVNSLFILFAYSQRVDVLAVLLMIARDTFVDGLRMSASAQGKVVAAGFLGKLKTVLQMIAIIVILLHNLPFAYIGISVDQILVWLSVIASLGSGVVYFLKLKKVILKSM